VIKSTFQPLLPPSTPVPPHLIPSLLHRFSTSAAYTLYPDIQPFLHRLQTSNPAPPILGVITNSDNRVLGILSSLGLRIRVDPSPYEKNETGLKDPSDRRKNPDIAFVAMSYDIDAEKPHRAMFDAARRLGAAAAGLSLEEGTTGFEEWECMHVGDDLEKDYRGAENAGWRAVFLDREGRGQGTGEKKKMRRRRKGRGEEMVSRVASLDDLVFC
jgi:FMN phosphatase YigB (HAD superfamily)